MDDSSDSADALLRLAGHDARAASAKAHLPEMAFLGLVRPGAEGPDRPARSG